jgi:DoxX-like family
MMTTDMNSSPLSKKMLWAGYVLSALPVLALLLSGIMKLAKPDSVVEGFVHLGYAESQALGIGIVELLSTVMYVIPRTSVLGAILLTGYLGGATATHVRVGEPFYMAIVLGILVWGGLYLRDERLRALLPVRSSLARQTDAV